jgi:hypothetical protein
MSRKTVRKIAVYLAVIVLVVGLSGLRAYWDHQRDPLFTRVELLERFTGGVYWGVALATVGFLISFAKPRMHGREQHTG